MSFIYLLEWWYGHGWIDQWQRGGKRLSRIARAFSGGTLIRTMFSPWKRMIAAPSQTAGLDSKIQVIVDNLVSRLVGFNVRLLTLLAAAISLVIVGLINILVALIWPALPLLSILVILKAVGLF